VVNDGDVEQLAKRVDAAIAECIARHLTSA
jgi:hypothetical protein